MPRTEQQTRTTLEKLQLEATNHPARHKARLTAVIALGYAYPAFAVWVALSILAVPPTFILFPRPASNTAIVFFTILATCIVSCILIRIALYYLTKPGHYHEPEPDPKKAAALWNLLQEMQQTLQFSTIHKIHLDVNMNAGVTTDKGFPIPLVTRDIHRLMLGWPFVCALEIPAIKSVLAHEMAHIAGRHTSFYLRVYTVLVTWQLIRHRLDSQGKRRWLLTLLGINPFINRYVPFLILQTTPIKRLHEYEADAAAVRATSPEITARTLIMLEWLGYLTERDFWPNLFKLTSDHPIPVNDIAQRLETFLVAPQPLDTWERFRDARLKQKTPITSNHPCLLDRLRAIGQEHQLHQPQPPALSYSPDTLPPALSSLLGDDVQRLRTRVNIHWKALCIQSWRLQHDYHQFSRRNLEKPIFDPAIDHEAQVAWMATLDAINRAPIHDEFALLREFIQRFPDFAEARFQLGSLLLRWDDPAAFSELEHAGRLSSYHILASLQTMLDYYRAAGRDDEAEPYRLRIQEHIKTLEQAQTERVAISRHDTLIAPDLGPLNLARVLSALKLSPRVSRAYLVQKSVRHLTDRKVYVLGIHVPWRFVEDYNQSSAQVAQTLQSQMPFDCAVVVFGPFNPLLKKKIIAAAPQPIYDARRR